MIFNYFFPSIVYLSPEVHVIVTNYSLVTPGTSWLFLMYYLFFIFTLIILDLSSYYYDLYRELFFYYIRITIVNLIYLKASKPKWVNTILNIIGVNSLRLWGLHLILSAILTLEKLMRNFENMTISSVILTAPFLWYWNL